jgi:hypothetical protein
MEKMMMISIVPATVWIAAYATRAKSPRVALKRALIGQSSFITAYLVGLLYVLPRFG